MKNRFKLLVAVTVVTGLMFGSVAAAGPATAAPTRLALPVTGTFADSLGGTGTFDGTYILKGFEAQGGEVVAIGNLTGTLTDSTGTVLGTVSLKNVTIPVTSITGTCDILHLELGPIDLDLLGLVVHVDKIVIDIDAEQGPGNLLGNLLCAIAGLLDPDGSANQLASLLNQVLQALLG
jgi:hypothetical protein